MNKWINHSTTWLLENRSKERLEGWKRKECKEKREVVNKLSLYGVIYAFTCFPLNSTLRKPLEPHQWAWTLIYWESSESPGFLVLIRQAFYNPCIRLSDIHKRKKYKWSFMFILILSLCPTNFYVQICPSQAHTSALKLLTKPLQPVSGKAEIKV